MKKLIFGLLIGTIFGSILSLFGLIGLFNKYESFTALSRERQRPKYTYDDMRWKPKQYI